MNGRTIFGGFGVALLLAVTMTAPVMGQSPSAPASAVPSVGPAPSADPAAALADPRCDPFLTTAEVEAGLSDMTVDAVDYFDNRPGGEFMHITCHWRAAPEPEIFLDVDDLQWSGEPFLITKHAGGTPVPDLGDEAYAVTENGSSNYVAWAVRIGDTDRTLLLGGGERTHDELIALARQVRSGATPGEAPTSAPPGSLPPDATALLGEWLLVGWSEGELPATPAVTFTFDADGSSGTTVDCKPAKGSKKPAIRTTYTVSGDQLERAPGEWAGACRKGADQDFVQLLSFVSAMATRPGTWVVAGDTLTIEGSAAPGSLTLARATAP